MRSHAELLFASKPRPAGSQDGHVRSKLASLNHVLIQGVSIPCRMCAPARGRLLVLDSCPKEVQQGSSDRYRRFPAPATWIVCDQSASLACDNLIVIDSSTQIVLAAIADLELVDHPPQYPRSRSKV